MSSNRPKLKEGAVVSELADGEVVLASESGEKALILNASGAVAVELLQGGYGVTQIAEVFSESFELSTADARRDIENLIEQLAREGLLDSDA